MLCRFAYITELESWGKQECTLEPWGHVWFAFIQSSGVLAISNATNTWRYCARYGSDVVPYLKRQMTPHFISVLGCAGRKPRV